MKIKKMLPGFFAAAILGIAASASAVTITVNYPNEGASEGFNDPAIYNATTGQTLGQARRAAFEYAAAVWANRLSGSITVVVNATFDPLGGNLTSATLGQAGPQNFWIFNSGSSPTGKLCVPSALANQFNGGDIDDQVLNPDVEITAQFNSDVGSPSVLPSLQWYYGLDENIPGNGINFLRTSLHELGHGLGFVGLVSNGDGSYPDIGAPLFTDAPSVYDLFVKQGTGAGTLLTSMSDGGRLTALTSDNLYWSGAVANQGLAADAIRIYAPNPIEPGSTYSHYREDTFFTGGEELMDPILDTNLITLTNADDLFQDLGWGILGTSNGAGQDIVPDLNYGTVPTTAAEGSGAQTFNVTLTAANSAGVSFLVQPNPAGTDTATLGVDYTMSPSNGVVTIPSGTTASFTVTPLTDGSSEATETATFRITRVVGAEFGQTPTMQRSLSITNASSVTDWSLMAD